MEEFESVWSDRAVLLLYIPRSWCTGVRRHGVAHFQWLLTTTPFLLVLDRATSHSGMGLGENDEGSCKAGLVEVILDRRELGAPVADALDVDLYTSDRFGLTRVVDDFTERVDDHGPACVVKVGIVPATIHSDDIGLTLHRASLKE